MAPRRLTARGCSIAAVGIGSGKFAATMTCLARAQLIDTLRQALAGLDAVHAAWEGGSAAFGSEDELSDADAVAVVADDAVAASFVAVEAVLAALSPVSLRHDVPAIAAFTMFQRIVAKEIRRGRAVDALVFCQGVTWCPLVEAVRLLQHGPQRRIFGPRYLRRDLPPAVCLRLQELAFVRDLGDLAAKHLQAQAWFGACIARLERLGSGSGLPEG